MGNFDKDRHKLLTLHSNMAKMLCQIIKILKQIAKYSNIFGSLYFITEFKIQLALYYKAETTASTVKYFNIYTVYMYMQFLLLYYVY